MMANSKLRKIPKLICFAGNNKPWLRAVKRRRGASASSMSMADLMSIQATIPFIQRARTARRG